MHGDVMKRFNALLVIARVTHNSLFTVVSLVAKFLSGSEAKVDLVMIQTLSLFKHKLLCYHSTRYWSL